MSDDKIVKTIHNYQVKLKLLSGILNLMAVLSLLVVIGILFVFLGIMSYGYKPVFALIPAAAVAFFILMWLIKRSVDRLEGKLKRFTGEYVTKAVIAERIDIREYAPTGCFNDKFLRSSGVLRGFDKSYGSDYIKGIYRGQQITYCDIKLEVENETTDRDGHRRHETVTVFRGPVISLVLGKPLGDKKLRILERTGKRKKEGFLSDLLGSAANAVGDALGIRSNENAVLMENEAFNNQFEVKTNDDELAFYILTPQFMEGIVSADKIGAGRTNICFGGDRVNIAVHNNYDAFELGRTLRSKKHLEEARQRMRGDLDRILRIVDEILEKDRLFN